MTTTGPRATFTTSAPSGSAARKPASTRPRVSSVIGTVRTTTSAQGSSAGSDPNGSTGTGSDRAWRATRRTSHSKPASRRLDRCTDRAVPHDEHPAVRQRRPGVVRPLAALPRPHVVRETAQGREDESHRELGGGRVVHAAGVAQRDASGHQRPHVVDPGGEGLGDPQRRHPRHQLCRAGAGQVGQHEEVDVVQAGRRVPAAVEHRDGHAGRQVDQVRPVRRRAARPSRQHGLGGPAVGQVALPVPARKELPGRLVPGEQQLLLLLVGDAEVDR